MQARRYNVTLLATRPSGRTVEPRSGIPCMRLPHLLLSSVLVLAPVVATTPASARGTATTVQQQLDALEARVKALEAHDSVLRKQADDAIAAAQAAQAELAAIKAAPPAPVAAVEAPPAAAATGGNANGFNPAISVILNGSYSTHSLDPQHYARAGFPLVDEGGPGPRGLSLGESEISLASNIDEKFYGQLTLTAHSDNGEDHVGVEEAFVDTTALPDGFNLR